MRIVSEWGLSGIKALQEEADVCIIVDVLSFSTCVDVACARGARIYPFLLDDRPAAKKEARRIGAKLAGPVTDTPSASERAASESHPVKPTAIESTKAAPSEISDVSRSGGVVESFSRLCTDA